MQSFLQASYSPSLCWSCSPASQESLSPLHKTPGVERPVCGSTCSLPRADVCLYNLPFPLSLLSGAKVLTQLLFFPSYLIMCVSFLPPLFSRSPFARFQLVYSENCSTCGCIFPVFMGRGELHIFLFGHIDQNGFGV